MIYNVKIIIFFILNYSVIYKNTFLKITKMKQEKVSPQGQSSALHWCASILCFVDLVAIMGLEVSGVHIRVLLPRELAVNIQETVWHHRQLMVFVDEYLQTQAHAGLMDRWKVWTCTLCMVGAMIKRAREEDSKQWKQQKGVMRNRGGNQKPIPT